MDSEQPTLDVAVADLGVRWEILDTGITVKLYPSCAATHPPLDALTEIVRRERFAADDVQSIEVEVDSMTPRLLIHPNPATGLEAKFSMPFCAGRRHRVSANCIDTFDGNRFVIRSCRPFRRASRFARTRPSIGRRRLAGAGHGAIARRPQLVADG